MNLVEGLIEELNRNRELLAAYREIPTGAVAAWSLENDIKNAESAMGSGDVVEMLRVYKTLKGNC